MEVEGSSDVTIDGHEGRQLDLRATEGPPLALVLGSQQVGPEELSYVEHFLSPGESARLVILDVNGQLVVVSEAARDYEVPPGVADFEDVVPDIEAMLATVRFE